MNVNSMNTASSRTIIHRSSPTPPYVTTTVTLRNGAQRPDGGRITGAGHPSILAEKAAFRELSTLHRRDVYAHWREQEHTVGDLVDGAAQREGQPGGKVHQALRGRVV